MNTGKIPMEEPENPPEIGSGICLIDPQESSQVLAKLLLRQLLGRRAPGDQEETSNEGRLP